MGGYTVPGSVPFVPGVYNSEPGTARIADLILRQGDIAANRQARSAEILGSTIAGAGQAVGQGLQQYRQQKDESSIGRAVTEAGQAETANPTGFDISSVTRRYDPRLATRIIKAYGDFSAQADLGAERKARAAQYTAQAQKEAEAAQQHNVDAIGTILSHAEKLGAFDAPDGGLQAYTDIGQAMAAKKMPEAAQYAPQIQQLTALMAQAKASGDPMAVPMVAQRVQQTFGPLRDHVKTLMSPAAIKALSDEQGDGMVVPEGGTLVNKGTGAVMATGAPKPVHLEAKETSKGIQNYDPVAGTLGPVIGQPKPPAAMIVNTGQAEDTKNTADMLAHGLILPTQLSKRSANYNAVIAQANAISKAETGKPLNMAKLQLDYDAARRFAGSMNGPQMVRFKGLAGSVSNTIDEVKRLSEELQQGSIQKWNSAKRSTILQLYGNTPQSETAAQYLAAVNTLKSEYASLEQGGMTPTEPSWKLANEQINQDFGVKDLGASLTETQRLINYRLGAFDELGPSMQGGGGQSFGGQNGPAPAPTAKGAVTVTAPNGKVYTFPNQGEADAFRKRAGISG